MEDKIGIERVTDLMGDCNTVNPATYCDISNTAPDKVLIMILLTWTKLMIRFDINLLSKL